MDNNKDSAQNQNINDVLEQLKQSYSDEGTSEKHTESATTADSSDSITADDLKKLLKNQYLFEGEDAYSVSDDESYDIDKDFLEEAKAEEPEEPEEPEKIEEIEETEEPEEIEETEEIEEVEEESEAIEEYEEFDYFEDFDDDDAPLTEEEIEMLRRLAEDDSADIFQSGESDAEDEADGDITFEELENDVESDGEIVFQPIPLDNGEEMSQEDIDDGLTFEDIARVTDTDGDDIIYTPIELENSNDTSTEEISVGDCEEQSAVLCEDHAQEDEMFVAQEIAEDKADGGSVSTLDFGGDIEAVIEEMVGNVSSERPKYHVSSADLSLLLQLGCDEEIFELASNEEIENIAIEDSLDSISDDYAVNASEFGAFENSEDEGDKTPKEALEDKILSVYENYRNTRGAAFIRLIISGIMSALLLFYDGLPLLGVRLPGIMDRKEYFLSYVLIGLQLLVLCMIPSAKQIWAGIKKLFTKRADTYSMIALLAVATLVYDVAIIAVEIGTPHVFHFLLSLLTVATVAGECVCLTLETDTYRYFFGNIIRDEENADTQENLPDEKIFTLKKSEGKNSTAEKMYRGGLDPSEAVYYPLQIDSAAGYFGSVNKKSRRSNAPLSVILPSLVISLICGILVLVIPVIDTSLSLCLGVMLTSLFITLPITATVTVWMPFALFNRKNIREGFAFSCEHSAESCADCSVFTFKDMHVFEKCTSKNVNLALYDATSNDVLIGCLDALYSKIGGPLSDVFSMGDSNSRFGECKLRRIAKSGVEATVGSNYAVLLGNEQFMARYGISFPEVNFNNKGDEIFSLCVSINGRASARIIAKYKVNEMFEMLAYRLQEDGIYCTLETFDPMISSELLARLRGSDLPPVSVVHLGISDHESTRRTHTDGVLFDVDGGEVGVIAKKSRLNLVVAASGAKRMKKLRGRINALCYTAFGVGVVISVLNLALNWAENMNEFYILIYWLLSVGTVVSTMLLSLPRSDRFSYGRYVSEREAMRDGNVKK